MGAHLDISEPLNVAADLRHADARTSQRADRAFKATVLRIEATGKVLAPVDTGALMNSVGSDVTGSLTGGHIHAEVGPTVDYGIWQEIGTSDMAGRHYMGRAFDRHIGGLTDALTQIGAEVL